MSTAQQKFDIASLFTGTEQTTLRIWFDLDAAGKDVDADRFLRAGLLVEHFQSRLDDVPANRSVDDLSKLAELQQLFQNEIDLALGILRDVAHDRVGGKGDGSTIPAWQHAYNELRQRVDTLQEWSVKMVDVFNQLSARVGGGGWQ